MFGLPFFERRLGRVRRAQEEVEIQDILLDRMAERVQARGGEAEGERKIEAPLSSAVPSIIIAAFVFFALVFGGKALSLQTASYGRMAALAAHNAVRERAVPANRGIVYDRSMRQLVENKPSFGLVCDRRDAPADRGRLKAEMDRLSAALGIPYEDLRAAFEEGSRASVLLVRDMGHEQIVRYESEGERLAGCRIEERAKRSYPFGSLLAHVLGYTGEVTAEDLAREGARYRVGDQIGKDGLEFEYDPVLRGEPGTLFIEKDASGRTLEERSGQDPRPGKSVVLSLDLDLQEAVWEALDRSFEQTGTNRAAAVALDPSTGAVTALVSRPGFDPNSIEEGAWGSILNDPDRPLFNRAISGIGYPTGSVVKPLVALAALEEGIIAERTNIYAPLELCVWNRYAERDECFPDWTLHGWTDVKRAIAESVNTFFYIIGGGHEGRQGLGASRMKSWLERFGWGSKTGIDLPGEGKGVLPSLEGEWRLGDTYHLSIGQGALAIPPIQVAASFGAVANGGTLFRPFLADRVIGEDGSIIEVFEPEIIRDGLASEAYLRTIREGMRQTVTQGSATGWLDRLPVSAGAKTGTAQTGRKDAQGKDYLYSWTVAFAPFENPEIVFVAVIEDAKEGTVASLPVARDVLSAFFSSP